MMQITEIVVTVTIHRYERAESGQAPWWVSLRRWIARLNPWTVAWYALLTMAGGLLYKVGAALALRQRGYFAVGGEVVALLLPVLYYAMSTTVRDIVRDMRD